MKFLAPTIVFKRFGQAGLILVSAFAVGFFAWPWVTYAEITLETFESYTLGNLNGQSSWTSDAAQVVSTGGTKAITLDGTEYARKNYNVVTTEVFAIDVLPATDWGVSDYNYIRFCNGVASDCTGTGKAGFIIKLENAGGDYFNVFNLHEPGVDPDPLAYNVAANATTTLYFLFFNGHIGFSTACETYGCSMTTYDPYYVADTVDDIDGIQIEANSGTEDVYYDNIRTLFYYEVSADPDDTSGAENESAWVNGDKFRYQLKTCMVGYACRMKIEWNEENDGNVAYLLDEHRSIEYDTISMDGDNGRYDWFDVPASSTAGYATFDILIENLNGYYTDESGTVGWKAFEDVWVLWESIPTLSDLLDIGDCSSVCDTIATVTSETWYEQFGDQIECGARKFGCWLVKPDESSIKNFNDAITAIQNTFPYNLLKQVRSVAWVEDENGDWVAITETNSATTTLDMGVAFDSVASVSIPILTTDFFVTHPELKTFFESIKDKIETVLYLMLFIYIFFRMLMRGEQVQNTIIDNSIRRYGKIEWGPKKKINNNFNKNDPRSKVFFGNTKV